MATFKARARTVDMLGRQQIAGIPTAISELFKNAHDAYAGCVDIDYYRTDGLFVLRDDGVGMTREDLPIVGLRSVLKASSILRKWASHLNIRACKGDRCWVRKV